MWHIQAPICQLELKALLWSSPWGERSVYPSQALPRQCLHVGDVFSLPVMFSLVSVQTIIIAPVMTGFVASFIKSVCLTGQLPRIASISVLLSVICRPRCWRPGWWSPYIARAVPVMDIFWWGLYLVGGRECMFIVLIGFIVQMHVFATVSKSVLATLDENMLIMWCHLASATFIKQGPYIA